MEGFDTEKFVRLPLEYCRKVNHLAFDSCNYYFTLVYTKKIIKTSLDFSIVDSYETCRVYDCICYDYEEDCFWASSKEQKDRIFKLNHCLEEIDYILLPKCTEKSGDITGISFNCCENSLIISFEIIIIKVNKTSRKTRILNLNHLGVITGVFSLCPGYLVLVHRNCKQYLYIVNSCGAIITHKKLPFNTEIKNIFLNQKNSNCKDPKLDFFITNQEGCLSVCNQPLCFLRYHICACNYKICSNHNCKHQDECTDIIESIALMEASLAHILNAEGEKLQKVIATTDDIDTLLCVNREVSKTIQKITTLEHVLYSKLETFLDNSPCEH